MSERARVNVLLRPELALIAHVAHRLVDLLLILLAVHLTASGKCIAIRHSTGPVPEYFQDCGFRPGQGLADFFR